MEQIFEGVVMGEPMSGRGVAAFDNVTGKHTGVWYDSLSTQIAYTEGECSKDHTVETAYMKTHDPMGNEMSAKLVTRVVSDDEHVFEYYMLLPDGGEFKSMEIVYTRAFPEGDRLSEQLGVHDAPGQRLQSVESLEPGRSRLALTWTISTRPRSRFGRFVPAPDRALDP